MNAEMINEINRINPKMTPEIERIAESIKKDNDRAQLAKMQGKSLPNPETTEHEMSIMLNWFADRLETVAKML